MKTKPIRVAILGNGGWGTALAVHLQRAGRSVRLWGAFEGEIAEMRRARRNEKYLPGVPLHRSIELTHDVSRALDGADAVFLAVPSQFMRSVLKGIPRAMAPRAVVNVSKGIEQHTLRRMSEVVSEEWGVAAITVSGPSIAREVALGQPASVVAASTRISKARLVQEILMDKRLRVYTSNDLIGVELGGSLKNPLAIAAGIADGLQLGTNAKAALLARGMVEMARLGMALGGRRDTFFGLSGMGDLITTCLAGRNHWFGMQIGQGKSAKAVLSSTPSVIEGVETTKSSLDLARRHRVELPIIEQVNAVLFHRRKPRRALEMLMSRMGKAEALG